MNKQCRRPSIFGFAMLATAACVTSAVLLAGCGCPLGHADSEETVRAPVPKPAPKPAQPARPRTRSKVECPPAAMPGMASASKALPTGNRDTSVVNVTKAAPVELLVGKEFEYVICLTNLTTVALSNVVVTETLPPELQFKSAKPEARQADGKLLWEVGNLAAGATKTFTVRAAAAKSGTMTGCTDVDYQIPGVCLALRAVQPALKIAKTAPAQALLCDAIKSRIVVTNTGTGTAVNVVVTDALPKGMTTLDGKDKVVVRVGSLKAGESRQMTLQTKVAKIGEYTNAVTASADGGLTAKSAPVTTTIRTPVLAIKKTGPEVRYLGRSVTYTIVVSNMGDADATDVVLEDMVDMPGQAEWVKASHGGVMRQGKTTWKLGNIPPNKSKTVELTLRPTKLGELRSTATASAYCARDVGGVTTEIKGIPAILLEAVDVEDPIEVGANETYVIIVTNQGSAVGTGIVIHCMLPDAQEFVSASGPTADSLDGQTVRFAPLRALAPKAKATYRVVVKGIQTGDVRFKVRLTSDQMTTPVEETESTNIYQ